MNRQSFLRNCFIAVAISFCPKSLLPSFGELEENVNEKMRRIIANEKPIGYAINWSYMEENNLSKEDVIAMADKLPSTVICKLY